MRLQCLPSADNWIRGWLCNDSCFTVWQAGYGDRFEQLVLRGTAGAAQQRKAVREWLGFGQGIAGLVLVNKKGSRQKVWNRSEAKKQVKGGRVGCWLLLASLEKMGMQAPGAAMFAAKIVALLLYALRRGPHAMAHSNQSECQDFVLLQSVKSSTSSKSSISSSRQKRFQPPAITHTSGCTHPCASSRAASLQVQGGWEELGLEERGGCGQVEHQLLTGARQELRPGGGASGGSPLGAERPPHLRQVAVHHHCVCVAAVCLHNLVHLVVIVEGLRNCPAGESGQEFQLGGCQAGRRWSVGKRGARPPAG